MAAPCLAASCRTAGHSSRIRTPLGWTLAWSLLVYAALVWVVIVVGKMTRLYLPGQWVWFWAGLGVAVLVLSLATTGRRARTTAFRTPVVVP